MRTPRQAIEEFLQLDPRQSALLLLPNPCADAQDAPERSFLGGLPFLPPDMPWPTITENGAATGLIFAGQIDLEDLPPFAGRTSLPSAGILYFFFKNTWEMPGGESGVMPCAVLFSEREDRGWPPCPQPPRMVAMNDQVARPPTYLNAGDSRNHGYFRFNLRFAPFKRTPDFIDGFVLPLPSLPDAEVQELRDHLGAHPFSEGSGVEWIDQIGIKRAWVNACQFEGEQIFEAVQRESLLDAVAPYRRDELRPFSFHSTSKLPSALVFCFAIIASFARGLLHPVKTYGKERMGAEDVLLKERAKHWLELSQHEPPLDAPSDECAREFLSFLGWIEDCKANQRISYALQMRYFTLCEDVFRYAVNLASEAGKQALVPDQLIHALANKPIVIVGEDAARVYVTMHHLLGHGSYDHTAVQPNEREDKVLLLRLDVADPMLGGTEGSFHFWISPQQLAAKDFSDVELTC